MIDDQDFRIPQLIHVRKETPEIGWGDYAVLKTRSPHVLAIRYEWRNNALVTLHNFHEKPVSATIDVGVRRSDRLINLVLGEHSQAGSEGTHKIVLEGYGHRWYRVASLGHIFNREKY